MIEFAIGLGMGIVFATILSRKKQKENIHSLTDSADKTLLGHKQQEVDELITVILPASNDDK